MDHDNPRAYHESISRVKETLQLLERNMTKRQIAEARGIYEAKAERAHSRMASDLGTRGWPPN